MITIRNICVLKDDSNKANKSEDTNEDEVIRDEIPDICEKPVKPEEKVQGYLTNLQGNEKLHVLYQVNLLRQRCM